MDKFISLIPTRHTNCIFFVMTQFQNSKQRHNLGKIVVTCLGSRGFEWLKRVSNFIGNDTVSLSTTQGTLYSLYNSLYTSSTRFGEIGKNGKITSKLWCNSP